MKKIIIDCDPGLDDLIALALLPQLDCDLLGITVVNGNQNVDVCAHNALNIVEQFNLDTPVYRGASKPMYRDQINAPDIHGESGIGEIQLIQSTKDIEDYPAHRFMFDTALRLKGELEIIALGPLTNLGNLITLFPDSKKLIKKITLMGGGHIYGNVTQCAEFNIYADPEAARIVFESGIELAMIGLDATMSEGFSSEEIERIEEYSRSENSAIVIQALKEVYNISLKFGLNSAYLHDPIALVAAVKDDFIVGKPYHIDIETKSSLSLGKTVVDLDNTRKMEPNAVFATGYSKSVLKDIIIETLKNV